MDAHKLINRLIPIQFDIFIFHISLAGSDIVFIAINKPAMGLDMPIRIFILRVIWL